MAVTIAAIALAANPPMPPPKRPPPTIKCWNCGQFSPKEGTRCPNCGSPWEKPK